MMATKNRSKKAAKTDYHGVTENIYRSNDSFRVRVTVDGVRYSKNFTSERKAKQWRNEVKKTGYPA